nr:sugar porter family MFS transporter [uncultured Marinifilum sp.]
MTSENQNTNKIYLLFIALAAAFGGFLFGYDTAVISGTIGFVKAKFALDTVMEGWFVSSALVGCIAGVVFAGEVSDRFGRKKSLILSGLLFSISAIGCAICASHTELIVYRLIGGVGVGVASMLSPLYISEVSPANIRGRMVALYQFALTLGILCAYFANALLLGSGGEDTVFTEGSLLHTVFVSEVWRSMFGSETIPALLFFCAMFLVPESPRWYASKNRNEEAGAVLAKINGSEAAKLEIKSIKKAIASEGDSAWSMLLQPGIKVAVFVGVALAILSQFTGINAIIYYGPRIMEEAGLQLNDALGGQVVIGLVNFLATIYAIMKIDKFGRKKLMKGGITGMFISLIAVGILFVLEQTQGYLLIIFILTFISSFAIGYGPVIWVLLSEIYPTKVRGRAMSVATLSVWVGTAVIGQVVPWMLDTLSPAGTFFIFALCCLPVPLILKSVPETKGMTLEDIESVWTKSKQ